MDITWTDLRVSIPEGGKKNGMPKAILKCVSGHARAGRMLAVMGATRVLPTLSARYPVLA